MIAHFFFVLQLPTAKINKLSFSADKNRNHGNQTLDRLSVAISGGLTHPNTKKPKPYTVALEVSVMKLHIRDLHEGEGVHTRLYTHVITGSPPL